MIQFRHTKTYFWDVVDLEDPELKWVYESTETSIDHNLYIINPWVFQSNYEAGLRILYFDHEKEDVVEVGHFDVLPSSTTVTFSGTWSNYPWYKNGKQLLGYSNGTSPKHSHHRMHN